MNSITFFKNISFYIEFYYQKTSVLTAFLKIGQIWDLFFFKNRSFYNEFGTFLSACFKNISFYNEFCMLLAQDRTKTYLCSKTPVFTINYAHFFKNISFYNKNITISKPAKLAAPRWARWAPARLPGCRLQGFKASVFKGWRPHDRVLINKLGGVAGAPMLSGSFSIVNCGLCAMAQKTFYYCTRVD